MPVPVDVADGDATQAKRMHTTRKTREIQLMMLTPVGGALAAAQRLGGGIAHAHPRICLSRDVY